MTKILVVTEYSRADQNSTGYYWEKIIERLKADGFEVKLAIPAGNTQYESARANPKFETKILKQLKVTLGLAWKILTNADKQSIVFSGTNPALLLVLTPLLKRVKNFKWVLLSHDVFPDNLAVAKNINQKNHIYKLISRYFDWVYGSADKIICIGRDMQNILTLKTQHPDRLYYAPNWVDENDVIPINRAQVNLDIQEGWSDKVVFQFFGNIGPLQGIDNILNAIGQVKSTNAAFVFIGGGASVYKLQQFIHENQNINIKYLGPLPLSRKSEGLAFCDVAFVSLQKGMLGLGVPSKTYFSLAADRPIMAIVEKESEIGLLINESEVGWKCEPDSPALLANMVDVICSNPVLIKKMKPREIFEKNYTGAQSLNRISEVIKQQAKEMMAGVVW